MLCAMPEGHGRGGSIPPSFKLLRCAKNSLGKIGFAPSRIWLGVHVLAMGLFFEAGVVGANELIIALVVIMVEQYRLEKL